MRRRDVGDNVVEIQHSHGCDRWLVVKKVLDAKKISIQTKSGADVESTEVALAFPLKKQGQELALQVSLVLMVNKVERFDVRVFMITVIQSILYRATHLEQQSPLNCLIFLMDLSIIQLGQFLVEN